MQIVTVSRRHAHHIGNACRRVSSRFAVIGQWFSRKISALRLAIRHVLNA